MKKYGEINFAIRVKQVYLSTHAGGGPVRMGSIQSDHPIGRLGGRIGIGRINDGEVDAFPMTGQPARFGM